MYIFYRRRFTFCQNYSLYGKWKGSFPSISEQHKIVEEIERRFSVADEIEKVVDQSLKQAERLRQSILKRAFEGKMVPQEPTDEPTEKLLERIKNERLSQESEKKRDRRKRNEQKTKRSGLNRLIMT